MNIPGKSSMVPSHPAEVELVLRLADGGPWRLRFSAGTERFIGPYPRLGGIMSDGPLLEYEIVAGSTAESQPHPASRRA